jgi:uncharacterized membrane protein SpoIIM required for sporulation
VKSLISGFWPRSSSRFKRIITIIACFLFSVAITIAGTLTPVSAQYSQDMNSYVGQEDASIKKGGVWQGGLLIFENNFEIDLIMFIPIVGPIFGSYALYDTGTAINAESNSSNNTVHLPGIVLALVLFIFPDTWLEFIAYSTALAASIWLTWSIIQRRGRHEITRTAKFIAICAGLLLLGAFIEAYIITLLT